MASLLSKEEIKKFSQKVSKEKVQEFYNKILSILHHSLDDFYQSFGNLSNIDEYTLKIFPMGDYTNDTFIDDSGELEIVFASCNPQLILNNRLYLDKLNLKKQNKKEIISNAGTFDGFIEKFLEILIQYFTEKTSFLLTEEGLKVFCYKEYGFKVLIRFCTYDEEDKDAILEFWNPIKKLTKKVNLFLYNENMNLKDKQTNGNYKKLVRIFKNIRKTLLINKMTSNSKLNKYFIELLVYNIPNELIKDEDITNDFFKSINYLYNCNILNFKSFDNSNYNTFSLAKIDYFSIKNFLSLLQKVI